MSEIVKLSGADIGNFDVPTLDRVLKILAAPGDVESYPREAVRFKDPAPSGETEFERRLAELTTGEFSKAGGKQSWYWLSFADPDLPEGQQFLGACLVQAPGPTLALALTHRLKINPGGCVRTYTLPEEPPAKWPRNKLLSKAEIAAIGEK